MERTKAISYNSIEELLSLKIGIIDELDFTGFKEKWTEEKLNLFYPRKVRFGQLYPPPQYLTSGASIRAWRQLRPPNQQQIINNLPQVVTTQQTNDDSDRAGGRSVRWDDSTKSDSHIDQLHTNNDSETPMVQRKRTASQLSSDNTHALSNNIQQAIPSPAAGQPKSTLKVPPPTQHKTTSIEEELNINEEACSGITLLIIQDSKCADKEDIEAGYFNLIGNACRHKAQYISNNKGWGYAADVQGFLMDNNLRNQHGSPYSWMCVLKGDNNWVFFRYNCDKTVDKTSSRKCCDKCWNQRFTFFNMCRGEVQMRKQAKGGNAITGRIDQLRHKSPSIVLPRLEAQSKQIKVLREKLYNMKRVVDMLRSKANQEEVTNMDATVMFDPKELERLREELLRKETITQKEIFDYLFEESVAVGKRIKAQGSNKGHKWSSLLISFACMLRAKCSVSMYDFFRRAFNLPPNTTLCRYSNADSTSPDGCMMQTIVQVAEVFTKMEIPAKDWRRFGNLGWDSHVVKDLLGMMYISYVFIFICMFISYLTLSIHSLLSPY